MPEVKVPDFDEMMDVAKNITDLLVQRDMLELKIELAEAYVYEKTASDQAYWVGGKPPSNAHVKSTYAITGFDGSIKQLREDFIKTSAELDFAKMQFDVMRMQIDLYRTESANRRIAVV